MLIKEIDVSHQPNLISCGYSSEELLLITNKIQLSCILNLSIRIGLIVLSNLVNNNEFFFIHL